LVPVPFPYILVDLQGGSHLVKLVSLLMRVMVSVIESVVKVCEVYYAMDLCNLSLCLGLLEYSIRIQ
jgi:hypothetical protein